MACTRDTDSSPESETTGWRRIAGLIAITGLYGMAAGLGGAKALQNLGMVALLGASLIMLPTIVQRLAREPLTVVVALFFVYLLLSGIGTTWHAGPGHEDADHWDLVRKMSRVLLIPLVAYWLAGRRDRMNRFLLCGLLGILAIIFEQWIAWGGVGPMFDERRVEFRLNPIWMGLNCSLAVLGLIAFRRSFVESLTTWFPRSGAFSMWFLLLLLMLQVVVVSQSRGAYLALFSGLVVFSAFALWQNGLRWLVQDKYRTVCTMITIIVIVTALFSQSHIITKRILLEKETIQDIVSGNLDRIESDGPIAIRMQLYKAGVQGWSEKPWFGWGPDGALPAINNSNIPAKFKNSDHFHNGVLDLLVRFGIVGTIAFFWILLVLILSLWQRTRDGAVRKDYAHFLVSAFVTFAVADQTESYIASGQGWFILAFVGGAMYTTYLWYKPSRGDAS